MSNAEPPASAGGFVASGAVREWRLPDRANLAGFTACLVAATVLATPLFAGVESLLLMVAVLVLFAQAWRLALARTLQAHLDADGVRKQLGPRSWRLSWAEVTGAKLIGFLGSTQLVLTTTSDAGWSVSDRLAGRLPRNCRAVQVPADQVDAVRQLLTRSGFGAA